MPKVNRLWYDDWEYDAMRKSRSSHADYRAFPAICLMRKAGLYQKEVLALKCGQVQSNGRLRPRMQLPSVFSDKEAREWPMCDDVRDVLTEWFEILGPFTDDMTLLFSRKEAKHHHTLDHSTLSRNCAALHKKAGLSGTFRTEALRRTYGRDYLPDVARAHEQLRNSSIKTTVEFLRLHNLHNDSYRVVFDEWPHLSPSERQRVMDHYGLQDKTPE
jgi:hypothetical protein